MKRSHSQIGPDTQSLSTSKTITNIPTLALKRNEVIPSEKSPYVILKVFNSTSNEYDKAKCLTAYRNIAINGYSLLGLATMAIPVQYRFKRYMLTGLSSHERKKRLCPTTS